jgi:hypothetical protein
VARDVTAAAGQSSPSHRNTCCQRYRTQRVAVKVPTIRQRALNNRQLRSAAPCSHCSRERLASRQRSSQQPRNVALRALRPRSVALRALRPRSPSGLVPSGIAGWGAAFQSSLTLIPAPSPWDRS